VDDVAILVGMLMSALLFRPPPPVGPPGSRSGGLDQVALCGVLVSCLRRHPVLELTSADRDHVLRGLLQVTASIFTAMAQSPAYVRPVGACVCRPADASSVVIAHLGPTAAAWSHGVSAPPAVLIPIVACRSEGVADAVGATALDLVDHLLNVGLFSLPTDSLLGSQDGASVSSPESACPG
jgi:hypothetical protein